MPLEKSSSKQAVGRNIQREEAAGKPRKQAIAIALNTQRHAMAGGGVEPHVGDVVGRGNGTVLLHMPSGEPLEVPEHWGIHAMAEGGTEGDDKRKSAIDDAEGVLVQHLRPPIPVTQLQEPMRGYDPGVTTANRIDPDSSGMPGDMNKRYGGKIAVAPRPLEMRYPMGMKVGQDGSYETWQVPQTAQDREEMARQKALEAYQANVKPDVMYASPQVITPRHAIQMPGMDLKAQQPLPEFTVPPQIVQGQKPPVVAQAYARGGAIDQDVVSHGSGTEDAEDLSDDQQATADAQKFLDHHNPTAAEERFVGKPDRRAQAIADAERLLQSPEDQTVDAETAARQAVTSGVEVHPAGDYPVDLHSLPGTKSGEMTPEGRQALLTGGGSGYKGIPGLVQQMGLGATPNEQAPGPFANEPVIPLAPGGHTLFGDAIRASAARDAAAQPITPAGLYDPASIAADQAQPAPTVEPAREPTPDEVAAQASGVGPPSGIELSPTPNQDMQAQASGAGTLPLPAAAPTGQQQPPPSGQVPSHGPQPYAPPEVAQVYEQNKAAEASAHEEEGEAESQGKLALADEAKQEAQQFGEMYKDQAAAQNSIMKQVMDQHDRFQKVIDQAASDRVNPGRYWSSLSTGQKVSARIGMILTGLGGGDPMANVNSLIGHDIEAQKANLNQDVEVGKLQNSAYSQALDIYKSVPAANAAANVLLKSQMLSRVEQIGATWEAPAIKARAAQLADGLRASIGADTDKLHHEAVGTAYDDRLKAGAVAAYGGGLNGSTDDDRANRNVWVTEAVKDGRGIYENGHLSAIAANKLLPEEQAKLNTITSALQDANYIKANSRLEGGNSVDVSGRAKGLIAKLSSLKLGDDFVSEHQSGLPGAFTQTQQEMKAVIAELMGEAAPIIGRQGRIPLNYDQPGSGGITHGFMLKAPK